MPHIIPTQPVTIHTTDPEDALGYRVTVNEADDGYACLWTDRAPVQGLLFLDQAARRELAAALVGGLA